MHHILLHLHGNMILQANESRHLGVFTDAKLNWQARISQLTPWIAQSVRILCQINHYLPKQM